VLLPQRGCQSKAATAINSTTHSEGLQRRCALSQLSDTCGQNVSLNGGGGLQRWAASNQFTRKSDEKLKQRKSYEKWQQLKSDENLDAKATKS